MKSQKRRLEEIERKGQFNKGEEVVFWSWPGHDWTEEQKEWICRRHPDCKFFMKPLSPTMPYGYARQGEEAVALYKDLASLVDWEAEKKRMDEQMRACRPENWQP
jgi:hypothetical protein